MESQSCRIFYRRRRRRSGADTSRRALARTLPGGHPHRRGAATKSDGGPGLSGRGTGPLRPDQRFQVPGRPRSARDRRWIVQFGATDESGQALFWPPPQQTCVRQRAVPDDDPLPYILSEDPGGGLRRVFRRDGARYRGLPGTSRGRPPRMSTTPRGRRGRGHLCWDLDAAPPRPTPPRQTGAHHVARANLLGR